MTSNFHLIRRMEKTHLLSHVQDGDLKHSRTGKLYIILLSVVMSVGLLMTGFGVYAEGVYFTHHQYNFVIWYPILCIVFYAVLIAVHPVSRQLCIRDWTVYTRERSAETAGECKNRTIGRQRP